MTLYLSQGAATGWAVERTNDEEQPEGASALPRSPLLREIAGGPGRNGRQPGMQDKT